MDSVLIAVIAVVLTAAAAGALGFFAARLWASRHAPEGGSSAEQALADARAKAQDIAQATRDEIQKDVDAAIAKADAEIAARAAEGEKRIGEIRASALQAVEDVANETAEAVIGAFAPGMADAKAVKAAVASALKG